MQKVITINLNGNAYQLDEGGYDTVRAYLPRAEQALSQNPATPRSVYRSFAYSAFACATIGTSRSASFHNARTSWYADRAAAGSAARASDRACSSRARLLAGSPIVSPGWSRIF